MCGICGLQGNFSISDFLAMLKLLKHRGEDSSGFYLHNNQFELLKKDFDFKDLNDFNENFKEFNDSTSKLALGHNLLSIFSSFNDDNELINNLEYNKQPIEFNNLYLVFNGEIYNFNSLNKHLNNLISDLNLDSINLFDSEYPKIISQLFGSLTGEHLTNDQLLDCLMFEPKSDSQLLAKTIYYNYFKLILDNLNNNTNNTNNNNFNNNSINYKDSDYLLNAVNNTIPMIQGDFSFAVYDGENLAIARDTIGVKPLFYGFDKNNQINAFASEKKALLKIGIKEIYDLHPGNILYNWKIYSDNNFLDKLSNSVKSSDELKNMEISNKNYINYLNQVNYSYSEFKDFLKNELIESVELRVKHINKVGLIFSGGVDSTILACILKEIANERKIKNNFLDINLYVVGTENSQDIKISKKIANDLDLPLKIIDVTEDIVRKSLKDVLIAIEDTNIMKLGVGMTIFLACQEMKKEGIKVALSGQGADELFGGYNRYLKHFENNSIFKSYYELANEIKFDISNMYHVNLERDDAVAMAKGIELRVPFLDENMVKLAISIPSEYKIKNSEDILRKHILRDLAKDLGVPDYVANRPKKAAQYGSGINKILKKKVLKDVDLNSFFDDLSFTD